MTKQAAKPRLSVPAQHALCTYEHHLTTAATVRNYLSDVHLFMAWYELEGEKEEGNLSFTPEQVATPTIIRYRHYLQHQLGRKPATINRYLISLKRYFGWLFNADRISSNPTRAVKLVTTISCPPRHLTDKEESDLVAAVTAGGNRRDLTLVIFMLHTGLRVSEVCHLRREDVVLKKRSGHMQIWGKRNKYREVPLNATVRKVLSGCLESEKQTIYLFPSRRTQSRLTPRGIGFLITKYARRAGIASLRPHDLRHRFGYRMAEQVPLHRLAQIMGHDSLDTTMIYIASTQKDLQQAVETIAWE